MPEYSIPSLDPGNCCALEMTPYQILHSLKARYPRKYEGASNPGPQRLLFTVLIKSIATNIENK